jgi:carbonic anhydrase
MILILKEGEDARGTATAFLEAGTLHLHDLNTERLPPGAGTIVLDWFATQAALQNRGLSLREIGNPQIFRILNRAELFDAATVQVTGTYRPPSAAEAMDYVGKLSDPLLQTRQEGAQFQVTGQPNPELLPPGLRPKSLTPDQALQRLVAGNERFAEDRALHPHQSASRREWLAARQYPIAVVMGCCDSRVPPEIVFDQGLGDLFTVRVVAHVPDPAALASVEFPARVLKTPLIVVLGHEKCAAIHAAIQGATLPGHAGGLVQGLREAMRGRGFDEHAGTEAILWNVQRVVRQLKLENPTLAPLVRAGKLRVVGAYYDLKTGRVHFVNL